MASKLRNPTGAEVVSAETNPQEVVKPKTAKQVVDKLLIKTEAYCFKPKKGSVFPAKRRLVKTMVFQSILKFVASGFCSIRKANPISLSRPNIPNANKSNQKQVVPNLDEQLAVHQG